MQSPLYELNNVIFESGNFRPLDVKKFEVHRGTVYSISGKPGSGKTVFLDVLSRNLRHSSGEIKFESKDIWSTNYYWADLVSIEIMWLLG